MENNKKKVNSAAGNKKAEKHPKWMLEIQTEGLDETVKDEEAQGLIKTSDCGCKYF